MKTKDIFISNKSIADSFIKRNEYPFEVLPNIKSYILELGGTLNEDYEKIKDNIWIHKSASVNKFSEIMVDFESTTQECRFTKLLKEIPYIYNYLT